MKTIAGLLLIALGIVLGLYVGIYLCFFGGIVQIINAVQMHPVPASFLAWGILKIVFAGLCGWFSFFACFIPGCYLIGANK